MEKNWLIMERQAYVEIDDYLSKYLREINLILPERTYHFTSNGRFALHDMVGLEFNEHKYTISLRTSCLIGSK